MRGDDVARDGRQAHQRAAHGRAFDDERDEAVGPRRHQAIGSVYSVRGSAEFLSNTAPDSTPALAIASADFRRP